MFLLVGFVAGPYVGVDAWVVALIADLALAWRLRHLPWRRVPVVTAAAIAALSLVVSLLPDDLLSPLWEAEGTAGVLAAEQPQAVVLLRRQVVAGEEFFLRRPQAVVCAPQVEPGFLLEGVEVARCGAVFKSGSHIGR